MWEKVHSVTQLQTGAAFPINYVFQSSLLIVKASASNSKITWHKAGTLYPSLEVPEFGLVQSRSISIKLNTQIIEVFNPKYYSYIFYFKTVDWLVDISLEFFS